MNLTKRQKEIVDFIRDYRKAHGISPTQREIRANFNLSSFGTVQKHLRRLEEKGALSREWNRSRGISPADEGIPKGREVALLGYVAAGRPIELLCLAVAGWMRYVSGSDEGGRQIKVSDPLAADFARIAAGHRGDPEGLARGLLSISAIFGDDLPADPRFAGEVIARLAALFRDGAARTVRAAAGRG